MICSKEQIQNKFINTKQRTDLNNRSIDQLPNIPTTTAIQTIVLLSLYHIYIIAMGILLSYFVLTVEILF